MFPWLNNLLFLNMQSIAAFGMGFNAGTSCMMQNQQGMPASIWGNNINPCPLPMPSVFGNDIYAGTYDFTAGLPQSDPLAPLLQGSFSIPFNPADFAAPGAASASMSSVGMQGMSFMGQYNNPNPVNIQGPSPSKAVNFARTFVGQNNGGGKFSQGRTELNGKKYPWCADFISYILEKTYSNLPYDFVYRDKNGRYNSSVTNFKEWGIKNNRYKQIEQARKDNFSGIKPGDLLVWDRDYVDKNGKVKHRGHIGFIESIDYQNRKIITIQGNSIGYAVAREAVDFDRATLDGIVSSPVQ